VLSSIRKFIFFPDLVVGLKLKLRLLGKEITTHVKIVERYKKVEHSTYTIKTGIDIIVVLIM
jgi:hypothetical protein